MNGDLCIPWWRRRSRLDGNHGLEDAFLKIYKCKRCTFSIYPEIHGRTLAAGPVGAAAVDADDDTADDDERDTTDARRLTDGSDEAGGAGSLFSLSIAVIVFLAW